MKKVEFTDEELAVLVWAIKNQYANYYNFLVNDGEKPSDNETIKVLNEISSKAYAALIND